MKKMITAAGRWLGCLLAAVMASFGQDGSSSMYSD